MGMMFRGTHENTIDAKGRVSFPASFRSALPEDDAHLVITNYNPAHLWVFTYERWAQLEERLGKLPITDDEAQMLVRFLVGGAHDVTIDKLGRILIPPRLREYAQLKKNITFVGSLTRVEIWSKENWDPAFAASADQFSTIAKKFNVII